MKKSASRPPSQPATAGPSAPAAPAGSGPSAGAPAGVGDDRVDAPGKSREDLIREAAYRRFEARGGEHGRHEEDWLAAESEVRPPEGN